MAAIEREFLDLEATQGGWQALFQRLHQISRLNAGPQLQAKTPMNITRNRYRDVLPIDDTRVKLQAGDNDYINANFVKVEEVNRAYILTQGPLQHTLAHFWQMIWEQKTAGIIMLNKCMERGMNKCAQYWPAHGESPLLFGDRYLVESTKCDEEDSYRLTHLTLHNLETEETRTVLHFHYLCWPDFGVPQTPNVFLEYLVAVRSSGVLESGVGPSVVHCSAGIGRSGTFCVVDVCLAKLEETRNLNSLNVQELLLDMRKQRLGLIQTPDQLRFSYIAILQGAYGNLGLKNSLYELSQEMAGEMESDSDSEELVPTDDSEEGEEDTQKYPNLNRGYGVPYDEDVPPPVPPRPPDTLPPPPPPPPPPPTSLPPPPPPTSLPPGPPETHYHEKGPSQSKGSQEDEEPFPKVPHGYENGEVSESGSEGDKEEGPPIPPRGKSLSPETNSTAMMNTAGKELMNRSTTGPFLGKGRGDTASQSPLSNGSGSAHLAGNAREERVLPPIRGKSADEATRNATREIEADEEALISELNELESLLSEQERRTGGSTVAGETVVPPPSQDTTNISASELRRRTQREDRKGRLTNRLNAMRTKDQLHQQQRAPNSERITSELSVPWLILGFAVMVGYCMYYLCT